MTDAHKRVDSNGADAARRPQESVTEKTSAEKTADKQRTQKSEQAETQGPERDQPASESFQESEGESKPFDFGGLPDRNLKKNLGCG